MLETDRGTGFHARGQGLSEGQGWWGEHEFKLLVRHGLRTSTVQVVVMQTSRRYLGWK